MAKHVGAQVNENRNYEEGEAKVGTNVYLIIGGKQYTLPYESLRESPKRRSSCMHLSIHANMHVEQNTANLGTLSHSHTVNLTRSASFFIIVVCFIVRVIMCIYFGGKKVCACSISRIWAHNGGGVMGEKSACPGPLVPWHADFTY
jgi:hypothetical protein